MGWQAFVAPFLQAGNTVLINAQGTFIYNGPPALGNLVASSAPVGGVDKKGNTFFAGDAVYGSGNSYVNIATNNGFKGFPAVTLNAPNMAHVTDLIQLASDNNNPGAANEQSKAVLSSGKENHLDDAALQLFSESADGTIAAAAVIEFGGAFQFTVNRSGVFLGSLTTGNLPLFFLPNGSTHVTSNPTLQASTINPGAANEQLFFLLSSGKTNGQDDAAWQLFSASADNTIAAAAFLEFGGTIVESVHKNNITQNVPLTNTAGSVSTPTTVTTDGWHLITMDAGWSTLAGQTPPQYRLLPDLSVDLIGAAQFNVSFTNQNIASGANVLPAAYRPVGQQFIGGGPGAAGLQVSSNGNLLAASASSTVFCNFNGRVRLGI